jgi:MinD superfamily P-loop ATPase
MTKPIEVTVVSGKGGTGKTVVVSSLARVIDNKVLADCDVDAPDLHLLLKPEIKRTEDFYGGKLAVIDADKCTGCGECARLCRFDAIRREGDPADGSYIVDTISCEGCAVCYYACPQDAILMRDNKNGRWFVSETVFGPFVHAMLDPAEENSGKLVSLVRKEARRIAEQGNLDYIIIDGPPGIGCPVISSVAGVDLAVIVTEPTVSGFHDCERVLSLAKHFGIRTAGVINKYDVNAEATTRIEGFFRREDVVLLGKVPFGLEVNRAIAAGRLVIDEEDSKVALALRSVGEALKEVLTSVRSEAGAGGQV